MQQRVRLALHQIIGKIDEQRWLDPIGESLQKTVAESFEAGGAVGEQADDFLHGVWLGHPLHPVLTAVPIGAWTVAFALDALETINGGDESGRGADAAIAVGLAGAVGAALAGLTDWQHIGGRARRIGLAHGLLNIAATSLYATSLILRLSGKRGAGRGLASLGYATVATAGYLGGELVAGQQIGVNRAANQRPPRDFVPVLAASELPMDSLQQVEAKGMPVLLVNHGGRLFALGDTCTHLGCSLAAGRLKDNSVICPCHGSRFALEDGGVLDGPATFPAQSLETRVHNGQIEVRAAHS